MSQVIIIETRRDTAFTEDAAVVLQANRFQEVNPNTFLGSGSLSSVVDELKNLPSYKKDRGSAGIRIHYGSVTTT